LTETNAFGFALRASTRRPCAVPTRNEAPPALAVPARACTPSRQNWMRAEPARMPARVVITSRLASAGPAKATVKTTPAGEDFFATLVTTVGGTCGPRRTATRRASPAGCPVDAESGVTVRSAVFAT
jgi:hypothetical protein